MGAKTMTTDAHRFKLVLLIRLALLADDAAVSDALLDYWFAAVEPEGLP